MARRLLPLLLWATKADDAYRGRRRRGLDARTAQRKTRKKGKRQGKDTRKKDEFARGQ